MKSVEEYINSFSEYDLIARNCRSKDEYKNIFISNCIDINNTDINIQEEITITNVLLNECEYIYYSKMNNISWNIILTNSKVENGFPFTIGCNIYIPFDIIVSYKKKELIKLLIHERLHIYQRYFPKDINEFILSKGYILIDQNNYLLKRSNPDIDRYLYKQNGMFSGCYYNSFDPKNINDCFQQLKYEHPYEHMSYELSEFLILKML